MWWLWILIGVVVVFIIWAIRRAEGHSGAPSIPRPRQSLPSSRTGKPVGGKRRADRTRT